MHTIKPKTVKRLSKQQYAEGSIICLTNAESHFTVAKQIAASGNYGFAVAHLILSSEELAKASALKLQSLKGDIDVKNIHTYFRDHTIKLEMIIRLYALSKSELNNQQADRINQITIPDNADILKSIPDKETAPIIVIFLLIILALLIAVPEVNRFNVNWLKVLRCRGLYVDYDAGSDSWISPATMFNKDIYDTFFHEVDLVSKYIKSLLFVDAVDITLVNTLISKLDDKNIVIV